ncbi:uncharacterized protein LOC117118550 [Anneissia japonica]|uniref:uncharacterized protein LOC117118550 n=1 Tax=Anneissia japonica TaxID=1529436 RepID=UPI0014257218|nr:uncharacterized protein LOC117118550 [Anneissia japonica]
MSKHSASVNQSEHRDFDHHSALLPLEKKKMEEASSDRKWKPDNKTIDILIDLFHKNPCLWDNKLKTYNDKEIRNTAMQKIAMELGTEVDNIKWKWNNIRTQYRREKSKEYVKKYVSGVANGYKSRWRLRDRLVFLDESLAPREWKTRLKLNSDEDAEYKADDEDNNKRNESESTLNYAVQPKSMPRLTKQRLHKTKLLKQSKRLFRKRQLLEKAILCLEMATKKPDTCVSDPDYNFGRYVADELKVITDSSVKQMAKDIIHCVLLEAKTKDSVPCTL